MNEHKIGGTYFCPHCKTMQDSADIHICPKEPGLPEPDVNAGDASKQKELLLCPYCSSAPVEMKWKGHYGCPTENCAAYAANLLPAEWNERVRNLTLTVEDWLKDHQQCATPPVPNALDSSSASGVSSLNLADLREKFDNMLVAEIKRCGGIPNLAAEEIAFRESIAGLLLKPPAPVVSVEHVEHVEQEKWEVRCNTSMSQGQVFRCGVGGATALGTWGPEVMLMTALSREHNASIERLVKL